MIGARDSILMVVTNLYKIKIVDKQQRLLVFFFSENNKKITSVNGVVSESRMTDEMREKTTHTRILAEE